MLPYLPQVRALRRRRERVPRRAAASSASPTCATTIRTARPGSRPASRPATGAIADFNGARSDGLGAYQLTLRGHWRCDAATAFLAPVRTRAEPHRRDGRPGDARAASSDGRAVGVEWRAGRRAARARAPTRGDPRRRHAAVAAAAAALGHRPGRAAARATASRSRSTRPRSARNLQDHYQARVIVKLKERMSLNDDVRNPLRLAQMGAQWLLRQRGPLTVGAGQVGGLVATEHADGGRARRALQRDAAVGRQAGRPAAPLLGLLGVGDAVPAASRAARSRSRSPIRSRRRASSPTTSPIRATPRCWSRACGSCARSTRSRRSATSSPARSTCRATASRRRPRSRRSRAPRAAPCSTRSAPAAWAATPLGRRRAAARARRRAAAGRSTRR